MAAPTPLTPSEKSHFLKHGYLHLPGCFTPTSSAPLLSNIWTRLGMSPDDKTTWTQERVHMPSHTSVDAAVFAPRAWAAICELLGGEGRVAPHSRQWRDTFIVNLGSKEHEGRENDPKKLFQWHVDGDFFVHYLDSPEQGLLVVPLFTDVVPGGGATFICPEGMGRVARHLYENPEGVNPHMLPRSHPSFYEVGFHSGCDWFNNTAKQCSEFVEVTGKAGDVFLLHPLMLHAASKNPLRKFRVITNPPVSMREPFRFYREDGDYSLVERATMKALGKSAEEMKGWRITAKREGIVPERVRIMEQLKKEELERLEKGEGRKNSAVRAAA